MTKNKKGHCTAVSGKISCVKRFLWIVMTGLLAGPQPVPHPLLEPLHPPELPQIAVKPQVRSSASSSLHHLSPLPLSFL